MHRASQNGYDSSDGWNYWKYVATYGIAGGFLGGAIGWGVGTVTASSAAVTLGAADSGGLIAYESWQAAEQTLRNAINSGSSILERSFNTPFGKRIVDAYNTSKGLIAEAKYGYQGLSNFIRTEIARDSWLLAQEVVNRVEWHFYYSEISQSIGPSFPLLKALQEAGIHVVIHF